MQEEKSQQRSQSCSEAERAPSSTSWSQNLLAFSDFTRSAKPTSDSGIDGSVPYEFSLNSCNPLQIYFVASASNSQCGHPEWLTRLNPRFCAGPSYIIWSMLGCWTFSIHSEAEVDAKHVVVEACNKPQSVTPCISLKAPSRSPDSVSALIWYKQKPKRLQFYGFDFDLINASSREHRDISHWNCHVGQKGTTQ